MGTGSSVTLKEREWHIVYVVLTWFLERVRESEARRKIERIRQAIHDAVPGVDIFKRGI